MGQFALTSDPDDWGKFRAPSLREVGRTAPYMHDGSLATLEDVVRFYDQGGGPDQTAGLGRLGLTDPEIDQLVAFLESLPPAHALSQSRTVAPGAIQSSMHPSLAPATVKTPSLPVPLLSM